MAILRLAEASQLYDAVSDPLLKPALLEFIEHQKIMHMAVLLRAVRQNDRDTMKEARCAGIVEAYENLMLDLEDFARKKLDEAKQ